MTKTTNLQLNKPGTTDFYNIAEQNENMDKIDSFCGRTDNPHNVTAEQIGANTTFGLIKNTNLLEWAMLQTQGGTFMTENTVVGTPDTRYWRGIVSVNKGAMDRGVFIFDGAEAYYIATASQSFENQKWIKLANADEYLPLTGGTLTGNIYLGGGYGLIESEGNVFSLSALKNSKEALNKHALLVGSPNFIDFTRCLFLRNFVNGAYTDYQVFGSHNKPTDTYSGTGATKTINTGGIGSMLMIYGDNGYNALVTPHGALCFTGSTISGFGSDSIKFANGTLTIGTSNPTSAYFNASDVTYTYRVL